MNNINTIDEKNNSKKTNKWKNLGYALMLTGALNLHISTPANASTNESKILTTEQVYSKIDNIDGLPTIYKNKIDNFLLNNSVMKDEGTRNFTLNFVSQEMESDRGISKENQLLFIRHAIYKQVTNNDLYDGQDGDQKILNDFNNKSINVRIRACGQKYRNGSLAYMNQRTNDAKQQSTEIRQKSTEIRQKSTEIRQKSAEIKQDIMQKDTLGLKEMTTFYSLYIKNPNIVRQEEIEQSKQLLQRVIPDCKKYGIDYRTILLQETGDRKKVDEILKFYGIED